jgi:hypothetical protein
MIIVGNAYGKNVVMKHSNHQMVSYIGSKKIKKSEKKP